MHYQDSRRVINPIYQDQPKQVRPRSVSNTTKLLAWVPQQIISKNDNTTNLQPTSTDTRQAPQNQRNISTILGGKNFIKLINQQPYNDLNDIIKHQHVVQSTKEKIINPNKLSSPDEYPIQTQQDSKSQERHSVRQVNSSKGQKENQFKIQQELIRLNKTENVKNRMQRQKEESKQVATELKRRMMNQSQKSQINNPKTILQVQDNNIAIITMQLKDIKDDIQTQEMKLLCQNMGYHMIKFDKEYDKINHRQNGQGSIQIRGINTDQKLNTLQRSLSRKGISIGEQNLKLKDFVSNKYLLKSQEHSQVDNQHSQNQEDKLLSNFRKFQGRQKGQF